MKFMCGWNFHMHHWDEQSCILKYALLFLKHHGNTCFLLHLTDTDVYMEWIRYAHTFSHIKKQTFIYYTFKLPLCTWQQNFRSHSYSYSSSFQFFQYSKPFHSFSSPPLCLPVHVILCPKDKCFPNNKEHKTLIHVHYKCLRDEHGSDRNKYYCCKNSDL